MAKKCINMNEVLETKETFYKKLDSYEKRVMEKYSLKDKSINFSLNDIEYECSIANMITQMIFFIPFVELGDIPANDFVVIETLQKFNKKSLEKYINKIIDFYNDTRCEESDYIFDLNMSLKNMMNRLSDLSCPCNIFSGTTINIHDLIELYSENPDFKRLVDETVPEGLEYSEIEKFINRQTKELMDILKDKDTCYKPYFVSATGINVKQFKEIIAIIGLKAGLDSNIISYVIQSNYLKGLSNITEFYITSILARKALITSHKRVKDSGYLNRKLSLLLIDVKISDEYEDCETDEYVKIFIKDDKVAERMNLRFFVNEDGDLERFEVHHHSHLIGSELLFRSPSKCKSPDGHICPICYGDLSKVNKDIHIGIIADLELAEVLTQKLLSAKHLQEVKSQTINWSKEFNELFIVDKDNIYLDLDKEKTGGSLIFEDDQLEVDEENRIPIYEFLVRSKNGKEIPIKLPFPVYLSEHGTDLATNNPVRDNDNRIVLSFKNILTTESPLFQFTLENNELSTSLQYVINLIETSDHLGINEIDTMINRFIELLEEGGIDLSAVHAELIVRELIRDVNDLTKRPERFDNPAEYTILKVSDAVYNSKSAATSLSFEQIKKQIQSPQLFTKKGSSILDKLYFQ